METTLLVFGPLISLVDLLSVASKAPLHLNFPFRTLSNSAYKCLPWILLLYNRSTSKVRGARVIPLLFSKLRSEEELRAADKLIVARTEERPARPAALLSGSVYITVFLSIPDPTC